MFSVWRLEDDECHLDNFERGRKGLYMTTIKEYREQSMFLQGLEPGRYMIVPRYHFFYSAHHK